MPIQLLSEADVQSLGSCVVLNDSRSVVKELVDNALDAQASIISIEISTNTLDLIQVKDNGHGVAVEDRALLCKRACTSKIRTFEDVERLGGSSLGFRGEALASMAGLSGELIVTTRVDGESAGSMRVFGSKGELMRKAGSSPASHPIGTTIKIQDFLKTIPVRRQTALKSTSKALLSIKTLLQEYAFARPGVRFSFKVVRSKTDKFNWTYVPTQGEVSLLDVAVKVVGQEVAAQCENLKWPTELSGGTEAQYKIDAVVFRGSVATKLGPNSKFVSVDGRPVSTTRGAFRAFYRLYKSYYSNWLSEQKRSPGANDPFLCLQLECPEGAYDINVEPSKDDVLFTDGGVAENILQAFLKFAYGDLPKTSEPVQSRGRDVSSKTSATSFDLLLARKPPGIEARATKQLSGTGSSHEPGPEVLSGPNDLKQPPNSLLPKQIYGSGSKADNISTNMFDMEQTEALPASSLSQDFSEDLEDETELRKASVTNPWSMAKINAKAGSSNSQFVARSISSLDERDSENVNHFPTPLRNPNDPTPRGSGLPSPPKSDAWRSSPLFQNPGPPIRRRGHQHQVEEEDPIESTQQSAGLNSPRPAACFNRKATPRKLVGDLNMSPTSTRSMLSERADSDIGEDTFVKGNDFRRPSLDLMSSQSTGISESPDDPTTLSHLPRTARKPFTSPFKSGPKLAGVVPPVTLTPTNQSSSPRLILQPLPLSQQSSTETTTSLNQIPRGITKSPIRHLPSPNPDLDEIMDFEYRKKAAHAQQKKQSKLTRDFPNPGKLAQIQRNITGASGDDTQSLSYQRSDAGGQRRVGGPSIQDILSASPSSDSQNAGRSPHKQSPHRNRYQAAKAALIQPNASNSLSHAHPVVQDYDFTNSSANHNHPLPSSDPRSHLLLHRTQSNTDPYSNTTRPPHTGLKLKLKRSRTSRLPLETIAPESATHNLTAKPSTPFPTRENLSAQMKYLSKEDPYLTSENAFVSWSPDVRDVEMWEGKLRGLIAEKYVSKAAGVGDEGGQEGVPVTNFQVKLGFVLKEHRERFS